MKPDLRTSSSDLERARAIARRLDERPAAATEPLGGAWRFVFAKPAPPRVEVSEAPPVFDLALPHGASWNQVVDHCLAQVGAMGMVVVDESGFVIASAGHWREWSELYLEAVSARLMAALDQVQRLEGPWGRCDSIVLNLGADFLTGLRVDAATGSLTVALLASAPLPSHVRRGLQEQIQRL